MTMIHLPDRVSRVIDAPMLTIRGRAAEMPKMDQLWAIVRFWQHGCTYVPDITDRWVDLSYFLYYLSGDCEDYAIAGLRLLLAMGWYEDDVWLLQENGHMVLAAKLGDQWWVLDPAEYTVSRYEESDVEPIAAYNDKTCVVLIEDKGDDDA